MQRPLDTSFIPQQPLLKVEGFERQKQPINFALGLALFVFFVVLTLAVAVFFYHRSVTNNTDTLARELADQEKILDFEAINKFKAIDSHIAVAKNLLAGHTVFTPILDFLEAATAKNVELTSLAYSNSGKIATIALQARAPSYDAVYFQGETWKTLPQVRKVDIGGVALSEETGIVSFSATIVVDQSVVGYAAFQKFEKERLLKMNSGGGASRSEEGVPLPSLPLSATEEANMQTP